MCAPCKIIINQLSQQTTATNHTLAELSRQLDSGELTMHDGNDFIYELIRSEVEFIRSGLEAVKCFGREHGASPRIQAELDRL